MAQQYQSEHNSLQASFAEPAAVAEQIYDAIYREIREIGMPPRRAMEVDRAIAILAERPLAQRQKVAAAFSEAYRLTLEQVFLQVGRADQRVNALALLNFPANNYATDMARALVGSGVRDDFAVETLYKADRAHRYVLEQEYNLAFWALGKGSLRADIKDKLSGWHEAKALILLDRDLTPADEIYFLSTGITLTKSKELIKLLYAEWYKGPRSFHQLVRQWDELLVKPGWATESLSDAMSSDVWNDNFTTSRANVNLIFNTYAEWKRMGLDADPSEPASRRDRLTGEALTWEEENLTLHVARESLKLSLSFKAYSDDHFAEAVRAIRDVWTQRILQEEEAGRKAEAKRRWEEWKLERKQVLDEIAAHNIRFGTDSREYARAQFMLMEMIGTPGKEPAYTAPPAYELPAMTGGLLSETDEIYLATHKGSYDRKKAIDMIIKASAKGLLKELKQDALMGKRREGVQLRPGFHLDAIVSVEYASLIHQDTGWTDATRLGRQLYVSLMDDDLANLKAAKELLVDSGMGPTLQKQVIQEYLTYAKRTEEPGTTEIEKFLHYIKRTYGETATYFEMLESLSPATTPNERLSRAEQMDLANQDGLFMTGLMEFYDWASGEDTREIAKEQLNQLRRIARSHPADLEWLLEQTGAHSVDELSRLGYGYYREAIAEVAALRATVTEACATAVEIAVEAALALATGGAAAGALVASLISAASGNLVREAVLDKEYDYFSKENVTSMVTTVATTIVSGVVGKGMDSLLAPGPWQRIELQGQFDKLWDAEVKLSKRAQFLKGMVDKAATTATSTMLSATPVAEGQLAGLVLKTVVTSAHGTGLGIWNAEKTALAEGLYQKVFLPGFKKSIATAITGKLVDWSTSNMGDKTIEQLAREMGSVTVGAFKGAVVATFGAQGKQWWDEWHKKQAELRELQAQDRERLKALEQQAILEAVQRQNAANREAEPFLTAKGGGELNAWYKQQSKEPAARLQEQISRYRQKVAYYENAVKNPVSAHDRWAKLDAGQREFLLKQRWPADRERNWRMLKVLEGIARERLGH